MRYELGFERLTPAPGPDADAERHEFVAVADLAPADAAGPAVLEVGGVATVHDVLVNGTLVHSGTSMVDRPVVDVSAAVRPGRNEIRVVVHPLAEALDAAPRKPRARWRTMLTDEPRLRWVRTQVLGRAPGFAPGPPVVGPYRPMVLVTGPRPAAVDVRTSVAGAAGVLDVVAPGGGAVRVSRAGTALAQVPLAGGRARVTLPDVELWWPHTHGTPALYDVEVLVDGGDPVLRRVGFRTLENRSPGSVSLRVNGIDVFCRGAVWTPGGLDALDAAVALGLNLVRVPGTTAYESDAFHARCDELGLLVWADLMFTTFDYPLADPGFVEQVTHEVRAQAIRLAQHPSTAVVCGGAEHEQQASMFGVATGSGAARELPDLLRPLVAATGVDAVWVDGSPTGGDPVTRVDTGVAQYFGVGAYLRDLPDVRHSRVRFAAECLAFANLPAAGSPADVLGGVPRDNGAGWDFADVREHYARRRYGAAATRDDARRVTGELMAEVFGEWRRPDSGCGGGIVLWLRDLAPGAGWGLLDVTGAPKPAALVLAEVLAPTTVWVVDEGLSGLDVHVAHDGPDPLELTLAVDLVRRDGSAESATTTWTAGPHSHRVVGVEALLGRFADASYAYRFGPPPHTAVRAVLTGPGLRREACWRLPLGDGAGPAGRSAG